MTSVHDVLETAEQLWPESGAEEWDVIGLVVGRRDASVSHIRLCVDVTLDVIEDARHSGVDFLLSHHPLLLRGVTSVAEDTYKGACITRLVESGIALATAHTNADVVRDGVSDVLARALGLTDIHPIDSTGVDPLCGTGRVGAMNEPVTLVELAQRLANLLPSTASGIRVAGEATRVVRRVALCGGAGDFLLGNAVVRSSDVYITSDLRHHPASEFREWAMLESGPALIDVSHWASEWLWLDVAAAALAQAHPNITVSVSDVRTDPWDFSVVQ